MLLYYVLYVLCFINTYQKTKRSSKNNVNKDSHITWNPGKSYSENLKKHGCRKQNNMEIMSRDWIHGEIMSRGILKIRESLSVNVILPRFINLHPISRMSQPGRGLKMSLMEKSCLKFSLIGKSCPKISPMGKSCLMTLY